jgi:hypothetical protein
MLEAKGREMSDEALFAEAVRFLEEMPERIRRLIARLKEDELRWKPAPDEFSALEQICHLRDLEREGYAMRIRRMLLEDEPSLADFEGGRIALERDYQSQDFEAAFQEFARGRVENLRVLKTLSPQKLERSGRLEGVGTITLKKLFLLMHEHDLSHLKELSAIRQAKERSGKE